MYQTKSRDYIPKAAVGRCLSPDQPPSDAARGIRNKQRGIVTRCTLAQSSRNHAYRVYYSHSRFLPLFNSPLLKKPRLTSLIKLNNQQTPKTVFDKPSTNQSTILSPLSVYVTQSSYSKISCPYTLNAPRSNESKPRETLSNRVKPSETAWNRVLTVIIAEN